MKANHILFSTLAVTLISAYTMSPSEFLKKDFKGRIPASAEEKQEDVKKDEAKKDNVQCKAESKGEKLEKEIKSQTQDIEAILKEINDLKKENKDLKEKVSSKKTKQDKLEEVSHDDTVGMMVALTSLFTTQMQSQMDMQMQMMSMFSQMQFNQAPQYTWDMTQRYSPYGIHENWSLGQGGVGIVAGGIGIGYGNGDYQNPYSQLPQMLRQPAQQQMEGFSFGGIPQANNMRGFDFNMAPVDPLLPQMKRMDVPMQTQSLPQAQPQKEFQPSPGVYNI